MSASKAHAGKPLHAVPAACSTCARLARDLESLRGEKRYLEQCFAEERQRAQALFGAFGTLSSAVGPTPAALPPLRHRLVDAVYGRLKRYAGPLQQWARAGFSRLAGSR